MKWLQQFILSQAMVLWSTLSMGQQQPVTAGGSTDGELGYVQTLPLKGMKGMQVTLRNLNTHINKWFILEVRGAKTLTLHLENRDPANLLSLTEHGISLKRDDPAAVATDCVLWNHKDFDLLAVNFKRYHQTFYPLCKRSLYVRLKKPSTTHLSATEWATEKLRQTQFGEGIISAIKPYMVQLDAEQGDAAAISDKNKTRQPHLGAEGPLPPLMHDDAAKGQFSAYNRLGITLQPGTGNLQFGEWYKAAMHDGVYVSLFKPELIAKDIFASFRDRVQFLKSEELNKLVYMTAYDMSRYTINYAIGTEHPLINTSTEAFGSQASWRQHLVAIGSIPPYDLHEAVGVFIGGFKNRHGRFGRGLFAGKSYGYIENGVILEPMAAGLATTYVTKDGRIDIVAWPKSNDEQLALRKDIVAARQNGLLMMENGEPSRYVGDWYNGNWSADVNGLGRSLRSAICLQDQGDKKHLLFMAFTSATPSSMARVMQAYRCRVAMHLDMNAYMYLHNAIYQWKPKSGFEVEYLHKDMLYPEDLKYHRFIMDNNGRDFFYIKRKSNGSLPPMGQTEPASTK